MNAEDLYEEWTDGEENGLRPARVQQLRSEIQDATGMAVPRSIPQIEGWLDTMHGSGVLTKKLRQAAGDDTAGGDDAEGDVASDAA